jgi:beta-1,4-mannosyltransferase
MPPEARPREYPDLPALIESELGRRDRIYITPHLRDGGINPYLANLYAPFSGRPERLAPLTTAQMLVPFLRRVLLRENSVWHQHWLQFSSLPTFLRTNFRLLASALYVAAGGRILWTVHNERPHVDRFVGANQLYCRWLSRLVYRFHIHVREAVPVVERLYGVPASRFAILAHPPFRTHPIPKDQARQGLRDRYGLQTEGRTVFLMFGILASYKGMREVADLFRDVDPRRGLLIIAGPPRGNEPEYARLLRKECAWPAVALLDRVIPEADVNLFFCGVDWVIYNLARALNSSAMQLAKDYGCRTLVPDVEASTMLEGKSEKFRSLEELGRLIEGKLGAG